MAESSTSQEPVKHEDVQAISVLRSGRVVDNRVGEDLMDEDSTPPVEVDVGSDETSKRKERSQEKEVVEEIERDN
ncbi:hypothetical protein, partial [Modestobacter italicus]|uniref:hypothetical protein n=1 Tax=Modestobacter italicus (strain DSM 44449 / CECT 9708 / BC 501) TaxID=2732864 RepID=UPI001C988801